MYNKDFWNERYVSEEYIYGKEPNEFLHSRLPNLKKGKILFPCEGEGRNAVFAASLGWDVFAFDQSEAGRQKAIQLAKEKNVTFHYEISDALTYPYAPEQMDMVALIYSHFHKSIRTTVHRNCVRTLKTGGILLLEAFSPEQLKYTSGGPKDPNMLYQLKDLRMDFSEMSVEYEETLEIELNESPFHRGKASIVRVVLRKI
ncbi:class I SAM-dependent methyltransferase [Leptospira levettii]|uniref:Class I SAM-dependent methyltransferase n=1 Tax=Leptospira levettii TaxID=2023178 RepID=A0A5F2D8D0_9LEPT|nr:class I SAM-dependent methyltransferase [Leptospira levettii]MCW7465555.1 class I SAM-dependent methyltransferase [Leptospira levettii]MCW7510294.1 class I SAM-dependent methyltransferase [Leptospira levettii]MCW7514046.1 class I SAM-dependent methyltransferase [Leptospira levettii]TGM29674.1 class I SAM-dependent methyltransferase [Leptospira levettii]TGM69126.1 class I SAM-dependent methyltransferase [Leptospira levettii]